MAWYVGRNTGNVVVLHQDNPEATEMADWNVADEMAYEAAQRRVSLLVRGRSAISGRAFRVYAA